MTPEHISKLAAILTAGMWSVGGREPLTATLAVGCAIALYREAERQIPNPEGS